MCHAQKGLALFQVSGPLLSSDANVNICMESVVNNYMGWVSGWLMMFPILGLIVQFSLSLINTYPGLGEIFRDHISI